MMTIDPFPKDEAKIDFFMKSNIFYSITELFLKKIS